MHSFYKNFLLFISSFLVLHSCNDSRQADLEMRERELTERERDLNSKEADYRRLVQFRDSVVKNVSVKDSVQYQSWPDSLPRTWNSRMICRESNCPAYVIGDQRSQEWQFISDSSGLCVKAFNKGKFVRDYLGRYEGGKVWLEFVSDSTTSRTKINMTLDNISPKVIKGTQVIAGDQDCKARFTVELTPSNTP